MQEKQEIHPSVRLFLSYAPEDEPLRAQLDRHLRLLQHQGLISTWHNRQILAGSDQAGEINEQLNTASIILLLVSSDFLASDYCYGVEMQRAFERAGQNEAYVIPVLLRPVDWHDAPFRDLPSLPGKNKPVTSWPNPDEAFYEIAAGIRAAAKQIRNAVDRHHLPPLNLRTIAVIPDQPEVTLEEAEMAYRQQVVEKYQWLNFGGFDRPDLSLANVRLEEVFVRLALTEERVIREPVSSTESNQVERRERVVTVQQPVALGQALGDHLLIVGEPGAGKSTLLRWLAVTFAQALQRKPDRLGLSADADRLPVLVELGRLPNHYLKPESRQVLNWRQFLPEYITTQLAFANTPPQLLDRALIDGRCLLLFDGLDEVADRQVRIRLAGWLAELALLLPGNRVVIGSRPAGVSTSEGALLPRFRRCQIERFTSEDVRRFFRFWYALDRSLTPTQQREAADGLMARVQNIPATRQLASTPLLATILLLLWRNQGNLPERQVDLYRHCCRLLVEQWETAHDVVYHGALANGDWEDHVGLLAPLAYAIHSQEQRTSATREELLPLLAQVLQTAGYANEQTAFREAKSFLDALGLRSGLLQYMGDDRYGFPHQTFQEYLAARYIAAQPDPEYIDLVMPHLHEAWWQQVHLLTIAHLGSSGAEAEKASALLLTILQAYPPPLWIWRSFRHSWLRLIGGAPSFFVHRRKVSVKFHQRVGLWRSRVHWLQKRMAHLLIGLGGFLPQMQLARRIARVLDREFEIAARGFAECAPDGMTEMVGTMLLARAVPRLREIIYDDAYRRKEAMLPLIFQSVGGYAILPAVLAATGSLHDERVRWSVTASLSQMEGDNEGLVRALLDAQSDPDDPTRRATAEILEQSKGDEGMVRGLVALLQNRNWANVFYRHHAARILGQVGKGNEEIARVLVEALSKIDDRVLQYAAESLRRLWRGNEEIVRSKLRALSDPDWQVQWNVASSLGQVGVGNEMVIKALLELLHNPNEPIQESAARSLGQVGMGSEEIVQVLLEMLSKIDWFVQHIATQSPEQAKASNEEVVRVLLETLSDPEKYLQHVATRSLGQAGAGNKEQETLSDPEKYLQHAATQSLEQAETSNEEEMEEVRRSLLETLSDPEKYLQHRSLGQAGTGNKEAARALLEALSDPDERVRWSVAASLGQAGEGNEEVVKVLLKVLHHTDWFIRARAVEILGRVGKSTEEGARALLETLSDPDWRVQQSAAENLEQVGEGNEEMVRSSLKALYHTNWSVRQGAAMTLGRMGRGNKEAARALLEAMSDPDERVRWSAAASLGRVEEGNEEVARVFLEALSDPDEQVRRSAAENLGQVGEGNGEVVKAFLKALSDPDWQVRHMASKSLEQVEINEKGVMVLLEALHDTDQSVQLATSSCLEQIQIGNEAGVKALLEALHHTNSFVRLSAVMTLGRVGGGNVEVVKALLKAQHDPDESVRWRVAESLGLLEIKDPNQLRKVLVSLNHLMYDDFRHTDLTVLTSLRRLLDGRPIPGYQWIPLRKRRAQRLRLKRTSFWLGIIALILVIGFVATWLFGDLDPSGFIARFLMLLASIVTFIAAVAQILGRTLRDPWTYR
jgi:HEAT repeat protein/energy-coupling factor transporter ATP-binding protein EcfA2